MKWSVCDLEEGGMLFTTKGFSALVSGQTHRTYIHFKYDEYTVNKFKTYYPKVYYEKECSFFRMLKYIRKYQKLDKKWEAYIRYTEGYTKKKVKEPESYLNIRDFFKEVD